MQRLLFPLVLLAGCASTPRASDDLAATADALVGRYSNAAQYEGAPEDFRKPPIATGAYDWIDRETLTVGYTTPTPLPTVTLAVHFEQSQRRELWTFRDSANGIVLDIRRQSGNTSEPSPPGCTLAVSARGKGAWDARTDPETCKLATPTGVAAVDTRVTVMPTGVLYQTSARLPDGSYVFRTPGGPPYDFRRAP
jgi:hypothetical protein